TNGRVAPSTVSPNLVDTSLPDEDLLSPRLRVSVAISRANRRAASGIRIAPADGMRLIPWPETLHLPRLPHAPIAARLREPQLGHYAGRGRYMPRDVGALSTQLCRAIGKTMHLQFAGVAHDSRPYAGQRLYRECPGTSLLA